MTWYKGGTHDTGSTMLRSILLILTVAMSLPYSTVGLAVPPQEKKTDKPKPESRKATQ